MRRLCIFLILAVMLALVAPVPARAQGAFTFTRFSADHAGATADGGSLRLVGAVGQADAGALVGGPFRLSGGFVVGAAQSPSPAGPKLYLPFLDR